MSFVKYENINFMGEAMRAVGFSFKHLIRMTIMVLWPMLIGLALFGGQIYLKSKGVSLWVLFSDAQGQTFTLVDVFVALANFVLYAIVSVKFFRYILLGERKDTYVPAPLTFGCRELRMLLWGAFLGGLFIALFAALMAVGFAMFKASPMAITAFMFFGALISILIISLFSLIMPAIAVDGKIGLGTAFNQMKPLLGKYILTLLGVGFILVLFFLVLAFPFGLISSALAHRSEMIPYFIAFTTVFALVFQYFGQILSARLMSRFYQLALDAEAQ